MVLFRSIIKIKISNSQTLVLYIVVVVLWMELDLADFDSIHKFANEFHKLKLPLNILVNNGT